MKYKSTALWLSLFTLLFVYLQLSAKFHFFYLEQSRLFLFSWNYVWEKLWSPGGMSLLAGEFLLQFFALPYAGAGITAALLTGAGAATEAVVKRMAPAGGLYLLYLLPVAALLFVQFDFNYFLQGTTAYLCVLGALWLYLRMERMPFGRRLAAALLLTPLLFGLCGAAGSLFAVCVMLREGLNRTRGGYWFGLTGVEIAVAGAGCVYGAVIGEYRFAFLPDAYYHSRLMPPAVIYFSWVCLPAAMLVAWLLRKRAVSEKRRKRECLFQLLLAALLFGAGIPKYDDSKSATLKELDYYAGRQQWDSIIEKCTGRLTNYLYLCYLNMALAEKGELADRLFSFDQRGLPGLMVAWNNTFHVSSFLSDLYFTLGETALSQQMAFEASVSVTGDNSPRHLKRLVQTNLIFGEYAVAEKYISLLEKTLCYRDWAKAHRRFLYNDTAVEADALLGAKRRSLPAQSTLALLDGMETDLLRRAEAMPSDVLPVHYAGAARLLAKEMKPFQELIETYYGTPVLPSLPRSFQEAVLILSEDDPAYRKRFDISEQLIQGFAAFKKQVQTNRSNPSLPALSEKAFGDTYWHYYLFK